MKELSIEEKAKRYDEAIEKARNIVNSINVGLIGKNSFEAVFPELKESEDEKIRKELLQIAKESEDTFYMVMTPSKRKRLIDWLENQNKKAEPIAGFVSEFEKQVSHLIASAINREHEYNKGYVKWAAQSLIEYAKREIEKQGEQKPADKIEPKFKVGDWVVNKFGDVWHIDSFDKKNYQVSNGDNFNYFPISQQNKMHLWTIQDAKDGDVLAVEPIEGYSSSFVAIYKKQNEEDFDSYCFVGFDGKFYKNEHGHSTENIHPATKEQRDLLFQKMQEAGYDWDAGKRELKKMEQKPIDKVEPKFKVGDWIIKNDDSSINIDYSCCEITKVEDGNYMIESVYDYKGYNTFETFEKDYHIWSIQDAKDGDVIFYDDGWTCIFKCIHGIWYSSYCFITADGEFNTGYERHAVNAKLNGNAHPATKKQRDLLFQKIKEAGYDWDAGKRELKKMEQTPVWTEEDEKFFKTALWHISNSISNGKSTDIHCDTTDWFKSLKDRVQAQKRG